MFDKKKQQKQLDFEAALEQKYLEIRNEFLEGPNWQQAQQLAMLDEHLRQVLNFRKYSAFMSKYGVAPMGKPWLGNP